MIDTTVLETRKTFQINCFFLPWSSVMFSQVKNYIDENNISLVQYFKLNVFVYIYS